jgi:two-component system phosphate regulon sensor histidine kinase PhoR
MIGGLALRAAVLAAGVAAAAMVVGVAATDVSSGARIALFLVVGLGGAAVGFVAFANATRTVASVSSASDRLAGGELGERVAVTSWATGDLTRNFNHMAARVQALFQSTDAEHARLEAVFDASTDAMIALSSDTSIRFLNRAALRILDATPDQAIARPLIENARDYELDALVRRAISTRGSAATFITFGPNRTPLRAVAVPIPAGGDWAVLLILNDLTEVQRVDQVRRDFLSNVSHELRTPLAAVKALVESLESGAVEGREDTIEFLRRIHQQVDRQTTLVNELLDLSRIESGAIELRPEPLDLAAVLAEAGSLLRVRAEAGHVRLELPESSGVRVEADRASILRVVSNLLDNAIKFSPPGSTVSAAIQDEGELVALSVRDNGPGISAHALPRVFERFYKGDSSRAEAGVGLGLAIVKHLVRAHGGTVSVESAPGAGATFTVRLPRTFVGARAPAARRAEEYHQS